MSVQTASKKYKIGFKQVLGVQPCFNKVEKSRKNKFQNEKVYKKVRKFKLYEKIEKVRNMLIVEKVHLRSNIVKKVYRAKNKNKKTRGG